MTSTSTKAGFVAGGVRRLFRVRSCPLSEEGTAAALAPTVLLVPPFAEEMNRSRRFLAALRRAIAERGACAELTDPCGTGDSEGDLVEATWERWCDDLVAAVERSRTEGAVHVSLLGIRAGCLLADEVSRRIPEPVDRLVHIQPETSGEAVLRRLLRARVARERLKGEVGGQSVDALWARVERGESLELGGYLLGAALTTALRAQRLAFDETPRSRENSQWFRLVETTSREPVPSADGAERASTGGAVWESHVLPSRPFWQLQDSVPDTGAVARLAACAVPERPGASRAVSAETPPSTGTGKTDSGADKHGENSLSEPPNEAGRGALSGLTIDCRGERLVGVLHGGSQDACLGLVVVVGGGQYRVGAHRQFVALARTLAERGVPVLRFDVRGMGDSDGEARHFLALDDDIRAAVDAMTERLTLDGVVLWGLCDGASASILYAPDDPRVRGVVLVNPWISTDEGVARTYLRHHYTARLRDPDFWRRLREGKVDVPSSLRSLAATAMRLIVRRSGAGEGDDRGRSDGASLPDAVFGALAAFAAPVLTVISDDDLTAREFDDELTRRSRIGEAPSEDTFTLERVAADHTFSTSGARERLSSLTADWVDTLATERAASS